MSKKFWTIFGTKFENGEVYDLIIMILSQLSDHQIVMLVAVAIDFLHLYQNCDYFLENTIQIYGQIGGWTFMNAL